MNFSYLKKKAKDLAKNLKGWRTQKKIVVIESDDWGSIRMPSKEVYKQCLQAGYRVDQVAYEKYDSLASEDDLELLFDMLISFKDHMGNHPVLTANAVVANPDFEAIEKSNFKKYTYELLPETFKRYSHHKRCFELWNDGIKSGLFFPQSHGREHLNVSAFMEALKQGDENIHFGFRNRMPGIISKGNRRSGNHYVESLLYNTDKDKEDKLNIVLEGLQQFKRLFGYNSESFIPPNYLWSTDFNKSLAEQGVRFMQGNRKMKEICVEGTDRIHQYYLGQYNKHGQIYLIRNALFEPSLFRMNISDPISHCLQSIQAAFFLNKPAIICSHRINFIGTIDTENRDRNLTMLRQLLQEIMKRWPDVEFMTSVELGNLIAE